MAVSSGNNVQATDYTDALDRVVAVLGNGSGQSGYGQVVASVESYKDVSTNDELIDHDHLNKLATDINTAASHQNNTTPVVTDWATGDIIGADASGETASNLNQANYGFNDVLSAITTIESNAELAAGFTIEADRSLIDSTRVTAWGGDGDPDDNINAEFDVTFDGDYATTDANGAHTATGADHRRHFFNAGGDIRITFFGNSNTLKDQNWNAMFNNLTVIFGKNKTTANSGSARDGLTDVNGGGVDSAVGNFQLTTSYTIIFRKFGSAVYASNYIQISAKRVNQDVIRFKVDFNDFAEGNPNFDERVLVSGGDMGAGLHLRRPTGDVTVQDPVGTCPTEFQDT